MLCGQAKSLGRLIEAYIGIVGTGAQPDRRYLVYVENRVQLPLRTIQLRQTELVTGGAPVAAKAVQKALG